MQSSSAENLAPQIISRIMTEIRDLVRSPPEGIEYVDSEDGTVTEIHAIITGPGMQIIKLYKLYNR
jgi:ubiquitin-protein ligase